MADWTTDNSGYPASSSPSPSHLRPGPPRRQGSSWRVPLIAVGAAVVSVLAAVAVVVTVNRAGKPAAAPTSLPAPTSPSVSADAPTSAAAGGFTADQQALVEDLPSTYAAANCKGSSVASMFHASAEILCGRGTSATGPTSVAFLRYSDSTALSSDFTMLMSREGITGTNDNCPAIGYRSFHFEDDPSVTVGSMASFVEDDGTSTNGSAVIAWTNRQDKLLGIAFNTGGQSMLGDMCTWWQQN